MKMAFDPEKQEQFEKIEEALKNWSGSFLCCLAVSRDTGMIHANDYKMNTYEFKQFIKALADREGFREAIVEALAEPKHCYISDN